MTEADDDMPVLVTADEAAILAHVAPSTIRVWRLRGKLRPVGRDTSRRHLYDLADIGPLTLRDTPAAHNA